MNLPSRKATKPPDVLPMKVVMKPKRTPKGKPKACAKMKPPPRVRIASGRRHTDERGKCDRKMLVTCKKRCALVKAANLHVRVNRKYRLTCSHEVYTDKRKYSQSRI